MRKKVLSVLLIATVAISLTGCASTVAITDKQSDLAAEYISSIVLKYNKKKTGNKLVKLDEEEENKDNDTNDKPFEGITVTPAPILESQGTANQENVKDEGNKELKNGTLESLYGLSDVSITYKNVKECKVYPENKPEAITARKGHKFLVATFKITNNSNKDRKLDLLSSGVSYGLKINEKMMVSSILTVLPNDLTCFQETVKVNQAIEAVVVFEVDDSVKTSDAVFKAYGKQNKSYEVRMN